MGRIRDFQWVIWNYHEEIDAACENKGLSVATERLSGG